MKTEDFKALDAFLKQDVLLELSSDKNGSQHLQPVKRNWFGRFILWISLKLGCKSHASLEKVAKYVVSQIRELSTNELPKSAVQKLLSKINSYNLKHTNKLASEFSFLTEKLNQRQELSLVPAPKASINVPIPPISIETPVPVAVPTVIIDPYCDLPDRFKEIGKDLEQSQIVESVKIRAQFMIQDLGQIENNLSKLKSLSSDTARAKEINSLVTDRYGRTAGEEVALSYKCLVDRNDLFVETYKKAKKSNKLQEFFSAFMNGGPCLTGRTISLNEFAASLVETTEEIPVDTKDLLVLPCNLWTERLITFLEQNTLTIENMTAEIFKEHLLSDIDAVASEFHGYEHKPMGQTFLKFLKQQGIKFDESSIDWGILIKKSIDSKAIFSTIYNYTIQFTKETLDANAF